jgi:peptide chain release factor 2
MIELDFSEQIAALRATFDDIRSVIDIDRLKLDIAELSDQAGAPDLWNDSEHAQKVTSDLSHRQSELKRIDSIESRLDDLEVLVELANAEGDQDSADEATAELVSVQKVLGDLEVQTLLTGNSTRTPP